MTLRKKLAVSTITASVALTAFAGIPLSNKGLAEKLGVSGVAYASSLEGSQLATDVKKLYDALVATSGLPKVEALQAALDGLAIHVKGDIVAPIVDKFQPSASEETQLENLFYDAVSLSYNPSVAGLEALRAEHGALLQSFATEAGVTDLTVDDIALYFFDIQEELVAQVGSKDLNGLLEIMTSSSGVQQLLSDVLAALPESEYNVEKIFLHYGVNTNDVISVLTEARTAVNNDTTFTAAAGALFTAYKSLNSSGGGVGGGGGGGVIVTPTAPLPETTDKLLNDLKAALDKATEAEKAALITKFVADATAEIAKLATINAASSISNINGKAVLQLDESNLLSAIAGINAVTAKVKELAPGSSVAKSALKFDLGAVTQKDVVLNLSDAVVKAAAAGNVSGATFVIGGFEVTVPVGGSFSSAISLAINKTDASAAVVGTLKPVSEVYDFNLTIGGVAKTSFDQPIVISLPLGDTTGLDKELLSVAKIVDGKLVFHGGRVSGNSIIESRDSFSSYVVVENKVSFTDIAKVEAWAGREIQVVAAKGAIEGKSEGKFVPQDKVTRAEFAKMLIRALDLENGSATEAFADVDAADWFAPYVAAAAQLKIINGRSASKFDPNATITRAEMATMIARALKVSKGAVDVTDVDAALKGFADASKINATLKDGVAFAATHKIVIGNAGKFLPKNNATRAEAAVIIYRALNFDN
ncbi:S-layer homology domain-containing protein [Paenibacillus sp. LPE1-1-1.1]|uniref:S-layer homology domain-containing protein n=1 Tax=Paenibacillus sp. LPE1-1-1.1 TaxID=3135230 RepID=UPI00343109C6